MPGHDIIVVGASAGGGEALSLLARELPPDLPAAVKACGGITVVQNPVDAIFPGMPASAIGNTRLDYVLPLSEIEPLLVRVARAEEEEERASPVWDDFVVK